MALEDFEKSLAEDRKAEEKAISEGRHKKGTEHQSHRHHHHRSELEKDNGHRHKRRRQSREDAETSREHRKHRHRHHRKGSQEELGTADHEEARLDKGAKGGEALTEISAIELKRDSWMQAPSALDISYAQKAVPKQPESTTSKSTKKDYELKIHENELNKHHLQGLADGKKMQESVRDELAQHEVNYEFGDSGSQWRMTKLKAVYREAKENGRSVEDIALERFGDLRGFDDAREEETELDRRSTYGRDYVGKIKPSGELFEERKLGMGIYRKEMEAAQSPDEDKEFSEPREIETKEPQTSTVRLDQTSLNRMKAQMMKAKLRGSAEAAKLEVEYNATSALFAIRKESDMVVLGTMENRMLAGGRNGEVKSIESKRGRERGLVEENEEMSIEDMVREERRTKGQAGGESQRFAERIAKDGKFDTGLDYMDENANKLAKRVQKSEINLKNTAISDFQKMNRILDNCPLCHHEDTESPPIAPIVSLGTRVYLTLPTEPEISDGGACIIPIQHRGNLLECDDDEWEEIRNFMKSLTRMYHDQGRSVIFYENAAVPQRKAHAGMTVVPIPYSLGDTAPAFFKEAIISADEEWAQHKKLIDTLAKSQQGLGKMAFRRALVKEMPYFHVWFELDGGLGHVVEDAGRWPKGDLFAREVLGGMLNVDMDIVKKQGRWELGDRRVDSFRKRWRKFDWTRALTDG